MQEQAQQAVLQAADEMHEEQLRVLQAAASERLQEANDMRRFETGRADALSKALAESRESVSHLAESREGLLAQLASETQAADEARDDLSKLQHERYALLAQVEQLKEEARQWREAAALAESGRDAAVGAHATTPRVTTGEQPTKGKEAGGRTTGSAAAGVRVRIVIDA